MSDFVNTSDTMGGEDVVLNSLIAHNLAEFKDDNIVKLGKWAFYKNNTLTTVELPSLTNPGTNAFEDCTALATAAFAGLNTLGRYMFKGCTSLTSLSFPELTATAQYAFQNCTGLQSVTFPQSITTLQNYLFSGCTNLSSITAPGLTRLEQYVFQNCTGLNTIDFPNVTYVNSYAFSGCSNISSVSLPEATYIGNYAFENVPTGVVPLPNATSIGTYICNGSGPSGFDFTKKLTIPANAFSGGNNMIHLVLRSDELCPLSATSAFTSTPISSGFGYIYVPAELVDTYKAATNWSTYSSQIMPITEYPKTATGSISDTWDEILEAELDGTYKSKYSIGDTKVVDIDGNGVAMQIVAMDTDALASDSSKTAPITWLSVGIIERRHMNTSNTTSNGWANTAMRSYLRETLLPKIESTVRTNIKEVTKTYRVKSPSDTTASISDTLWIPSYKEVGFTNTSYVENEGVVYSDVFTSNTGRVKKYGNYGTGSAGFWWLRSAYNSAIFRCVISSGAESYDGASNSYGVVLGFCT